MTTPKRELTLSLDETGHLVITALEDGKLLMQTVRPIRPPPPVRDIGQLGAAPMLGMLWEWKWAPHKFVISIDDETVGLLGVRDKETLISRLLNDYKVLWSDAN